MATVIEVFKGDLDNAENVSATLTPASKPALYVKHDGPGNIQLKIQVWANAGDAAPTEYTATVGVTTGVRLTPSLFDSPFAECVITTIAKGSCTAIAVHMVEA